MEKEGQYWVLVRGVGGIQQILCLKEEICETTTNSENS